MISPSEAIELIHLLAVERGIEVKFIQPYHIRLTGRDNKRLDYFPNSTRATWVSSQKWFSIDDIEKFLMENF